jgi:hypothetical protein
LQKELPLSSKCKMFNLVIPCAQKSLNLAARICQVSKVWSLWPSMSYVLGGWTLAHEWMFWIMPASSSVTRKGQHPRRELYGHGNVLFRCSFQDTIDLYRSSDLHIVCIYIYVYIQFMDVVSFSYSFGIFWISPSISKQKRTQASSFNELLQCFRFGPWEKLQPCRFSDRRSLFEYGWGPGTWKRHEVSWWVKDDERFVMDENRWTIIWGCIKTIQNQSCYIWGDEHPFYQLFGVH